ncbi:Hypothetical protein F387_01195 [Wohlfahrtiimonas chitiniclastica SH04]|uniref:Uncharacterized protein n=1 Tax=Wohlfahrtiimonas chitiniclastica SH04 TaxID=1261130 RepID=L8Y0K1_9GAMM|nr:hypothetical protein [Wohlfahrtiimonas chitiniclastica]ELV08594.1 Hypothetical protein F387_01195 [Wohlfahrtiimonas chitiniclastica SH04]
MGVLDEYIKMGGLRGKAQELLERAILDENRDDEFNAIAKLIKTNDIPLDNILFDAVNAYNECDEEIKTLNEEIKPLDEKQRYLILLILTIQENNQGDNDFIFKGVNIMVKAARQNKIRLKIAHDCNGNPQTTLEMIEKFSGSKLHQDAPFDFINEAMIIGGIIQGKSDKANAGRQKGKKEKDQLRAEWDAWKGNKVNIGNFINAYIEKNGGWKEDGKRANGHSDKTLRKWVNEFKKEK